ncbi:MAG TPA: PHP domain-containing protein [Spirochaetota bacterium]|nr:PHP domain-containing protein [Spirochaetota bacterium]HOL57558.1 PHP domain-containing protein [Spirochaetota bacterium]HPP05044.1 PHP domain-containing protein [Spirochaetota bacterium]
MIIDLHNHTSELSLCSIVSVDTLINKYIGKIDGLCITDHNKIFSPSDQKKIKEKYKDKIKIFFGIEIDTDVGHILMFASNFKQFERVNFDELKNQAFLEIVKKVDRDKVAFIWAHPLRWARLYSKDRYLYKEFLDNFEAIELLNGNLPEETINLTKEKFDKFNVKYTGGSDTHSLEMALKCATKFSVSIQNEEEFVSALKNDNYYPIKIGH